MPEIFFPQLPDCVYIETSDALPAAPPAGTLHRLTKFKLHIAPGGIAAPLTTLRTLSNAKGEILEVEFRDNRWWLFQCLGKNGGAIDCELNHTKLGGPVDVPLVELGYAGKPELHIRKAVGEPGLFLSVEAVNGDVDRGRVTNKDFAHGVQAYLTWDKVDDGDKSTLACTFPIGWNPPGNWKGNKLNPRPYFVGDRAKDELRLVMGRANHFVVSPDTPTSKLAWVHEIYVGGLSVRLSEEPDVDFLLVASKSAFEFTYRRTGDVSGLRYLNASADRVGRLNVDGRDEAPIATARLTSDWIWLTFRGSRETRLELRGGVGFSDYAGDLVGQTRDFFAILPAVRKTSRDLWFVYRAAAMPPRDPYTGLALTAIPDRAGGALRWDCEGALFYVPGNGQSGDLYVGRECQQIWPAPGLGPDWDKLSRPRIKRGGNGQRQAAVPVGDTAYLRLVDGEDDLLPSKSSFELSLALSETNYSGEITLPVAGLSAAPVDLFAEDAQGAFAWWNLDLAKEIAPFPLQNGAFDWPPNFFDGLKPVAGPGEHLMLADHAARLIEMEALKDGTSLTPQAQPGRVAYDNAAIGFLGRPTLSALDDEDGPKTKKLAPKDIILRRTSQNTAAIEPNEGVGRIAYICTHKQLGGTLFASEGTRIIADAIGDDPSSYEKVWIDVMGGFGLALLLTDDQGKHYWFEQHALTTKAAAGRVPALIIDLNQGDDGISRGDKLGYTPQEWTNVLAPFASSKHPLPNAPGFQGHLFRDFSLAFPPVSSQYFDKLPALRRLYEKFEKVVFVDIAWHDGKKWSLKARDRAAPYHLFDNALVKLSIEDFSLELLSGEISGGSGGLKLAFPFLQEKGAEAQVVTRFTMRPGVKILEFNGRTYDFNKPTEYEFNFNYLEKFVVKEVGTDLKTVSLRGELHFKDIDFLKSRPLKIRLQLPLTDLEQNIRVNAELADVLEVSMDGWNLAITAVALNLSKSSSGTVVVGAELNGVLNLGVDGFLAAHFRVLIDRSGFKVVIDKYSAKLTIGDFSAQLELEYKEPKPGAKREFLGELGLSSPWTGDIGLKARIWQAGGETSWIAAWEAGDIEGQHFQLVEPKFILGHRARISKGATTLNDALLDPSAKTVEAAISAGSLADWEADPKTDLVIGAAGGFGLNKDWFRAPTAKDKRTGIMLGSGGFFKLSAHSDFLGFMTVNYDLTIDTQRKFIFAGFQVPKFDPLSGRTGSTSKSSFEVSGGYVGVGVGYDPSNWQFGLTIGWPYSSFLDPDVATPDWSRAVMVHWDGAFPLNTFMGGISLYLSEKTQSFGQALRAGWTWGYSASAWKLSAEAELGIMVGGVLHFTISSRAHARPAAPLVRAITSRSLVPTATELSNQVSNILGPEVQLAAALLGLVDDTFDSLVQATDIGIRCGLFLDAWGHARVTFYGVTLLGVRIDAHAQVYIAYQQGRIRSAYAHAEFSVSIKIGCTSYSTSASFRIDFIKSSGSKSASLIAFARYGALPAPRAALEAAHG